MKTIAIQHNAYATVISGAGPTILIFSRKENSGELVRSLNSQVVSCHSELVDINISRKRTNCIPIDALYCKIVLNAE